MLHIQGEPVGGSADHQELVRKVSSLPSLFSKPEFWSELQCPDDSTADKVVRLKDTANQLINRFEEEGDTEFLEKAIAKLEQAFEHAQTPQMKVRIAGNLAVACLEHQPEYQRVRAGKVVLAQAIRIAADQGWWGEMTNLLDQSADFTRLRASEMEQQQNETLARRLRSAVRRLRDQAKLHGQAKPVRSALTIEQGEYGISDDQPIGTDNVHDCVVILARNIETKTCLVAHIDNGICPQFSLPLDRLGPGRIEMHLLGAKYSMQDGSWDNLSKVLNRLRTVPRSSAQKIDLISATVFGGSDQPQACVIDPRTGWLQHARAATHSPERRLRISITVLGQDKDLQEAFDLTRNDSYNAPFVGEMALKAYYNRFNGCSGDQISMEFGGDSERADILTAFLEDFNKAIQASDDWLQAQARIGLEQMVRRKGITLSQKQKDDWLHCKVPAMLKGIPRHLGKQAEAANAELGKFIRESLFSTNFFGMINLDKQGLKAIAYQYRGKLPRSPVTGRTATNRPGGGNNLA